MKKYYRITVVRSVTLEMEAEIDVETFDRTGSLVLLTEESEAEVINRAEEAFNQGGYEGPFIHSVEEIEK